MHTAARRSDPWGSIALLAALGSACVPSGGDGWAPARELGPRTIPDDPTPRSGDPTPAPDPAPGPRDAPPAGNPGGAAITAVRVDPPQPTLDPGATVALRAFGRSLDGQETDRTSDARWASADPRIVAVDGSGLAVAVAPGTVEVVARLGEVVGSGRITVRPAGVAHLQLDRLSFDLDAGGSQRLVATAVGADGARVDVTQGAVWSTSDPAVATAAAGLVRAVGPGTALITATSLGLRADAALTVRAPQTPPPSGGGGGDTTPPPPPPSGGGGDTTPPPPSGGGSGGGDTAPPPPSGGGSDAGTAPPPTGGSDAGTAPPPPSGGSDAGTTPPPPSDCSYPAGPHELNVNRTIPPLVWAEGYDESGNNVGLDLEAIHCDPRFADRSVIVFVVSAEWCPSCPDYVRRLGNDAAAITAAGGLVVYAEIEDRSYQPASAQLARSAIDRLIGSAPGIRVGAAPNRAVYRAPLIRAFPTAFVVRRSDMRVIEGGSGRYFDFVGLARQNGGPPPAPACGPSDEESYEPNDTAAQAQVLPIGSFMGGICGANSDFYRIDRPGRWRVHLDFSHAVGDLDLYLWDEARNAYRTDGSGRKIGSDSNTDDEQYDGSGPAVITILGYQGARAPYTLTLSDRP